MGASFSLHCLFGQCLNGYPLHLSTESRPTNRISEEFGSDLKRVDHADISKVGRSTEAVLYHLGRRTFLFAWEECVVAQIEAKIENDGLLNETKQNVPALIDALDQLRDALPSLVTNLTM